MPAESQASSLRVLAHVWTSMPTDDLAKNMLDRKWARNSRSIGDCLSQTSQTRSCMSEPLRHVQRTDCSHPVLLKHSALSIFFRRFCPSFVPCGCAITGELICDIDFPLGSEADEVKDQDEPSAIKRVQSRRCIIRNAQVCQEPFSANWP